jgi:tetratricopeptide (TPR) repeat protein
MIAMIAAGLLIFSAAHASSPFVVECQTMESLKATAKNESDGASRLVAMRAAFDRVRWLDQEFKRRPLELPESFIRHCRAQSIEIFQIHRDQSPPATRALPEFWSIQARLSAHNGDFERSFNEYTTALQAGTPDVELRSEALQTWIKLSLDRLAEAQAAGPGAPGGHEIVARMVKKTRELVDPILKAGRSPQVRARQMEALRLYADMLEKAHLAVEAADEWTRLLELAPQDTEAGARVVIYHLARNNVAAAMPLLLRFTSVTKPNPFYVEKLAKVYADGGQPSEVIALLSRFLHDRGAKAAATPTLQALYLNALTETHRVDEAERFLASLPRARQNAPALAKARALLGVAQARRLATSGRKTQAFAAYAVYLRRFPKDQEVAFEAAALLLEGTPEDQRQAAQLVRAFTRAPASLSKAQLLTGIRATAADPASSGIIARLCSHHRAEFGELPESILLTCVAGWAHAGPGPASEEAAEALTKAIESAKGSPREATYRKRLMEL